MTANSLAIRCRSASRTAWKPSSRWASSLQGHEDILEENEDVVHVVGKLLDPSRSLALLCSARSTLLVYHGPTMSPSAPRKLKPHEVPYRELYPDTDADAERVQMEIYRRMPPWRKIQLVEEANQMSRSLALAGLRSRFPHASPEEICRRFFGLWLGEDLAAEVYGPLE